MEVESPAYTHREDALTAVPIKLTSPQVTRTPAGTPVAPPVARTIAVAGVQLHYYESQPAEPSAKPPLLLLHSLLATAETFAALTRNLPRDRRIVALDLLSAMPLTAAPLETAPPAAKEPLAVNCASLTELIHQFAHAVALQRPVLVGHSLGGALALRLAAVHTDSVTALALLSPAHPFAGYREHVVRFYLTHWGRFLALRIPLAPNWMILRAYNAATGSRKALTPAHLKPYLRILRSRRALKRVLLILSHWEADMDTLREALLRSPIAQPTLLLWGDHDVIVPIESAPALERCLRLSERTNLPGKGHLLVEEVPELCGERISDWLASLDVAKVDSAKLSGLNS